MQCNTAIGTLQSVEVMIRACMRVLHRRPFIRQLTKILVQWEIGFPPFQLMKRQVNFMPFAIVLMMGSSAFITPASYQTNFMVYVPGGYKFTDFVKMGFPLTIIVGAISSILAPVFFGFKVHCSGICYG